MYKNLILDLYGTLIDVEIDETSDLLWDKLAIFFGYYGAHYEPHELLERYKKILNKLNNSIEDSSEIDIQDVFYKLFIDKKVKPKKKMTKGVARVFRLLSTKNIELKEDVKETLSNIKKENVNIYLISNAQHIYVNAELKLLDIKKYFEGIYITSEYECSKEALFKNLFEIEKIKKKDTVFASVNKDNLELAKKLGLNSYEIITGNFNELKKKVLS